MSDPIRLWMSDVQKAAGQTEIHQNDVERIEHVTHPAMTKLLQRLESKGFIRCVPSGDRPEV